MTAGHKKGKNDNLSLLHAAAWLSELFKNNTQKLQATGRLTTCHKLAADRPLVLLKIKWI